MERIGFLGLGTMGAAMAANLARAGFPVTGLEPDARVVRPELAELGVDMAPNPAAAAADADIVGDLRLGHAGRRGRPVRPGRRRRRAPAPAPWSSTARRSRRRAAGTSRPGSASTGSSMVDAPVSGGSEGAQKATLTIFVGGDADDVERARPVLAAMGRTITHVGPIGAGQAVKAVNQVILAGDLSRCRRGDRPGDQGRPRRRAGRRRRSAAAPRRAGSSRIGAGGCSTTTTRSGSRSPSTARTSGSPSSWPRSSAPSCRSARLPRSSRSGSSPSGHGDDDMSALARSIRGLSAPRGLTAGRRLSRSADQQHRVAQLAVVARPESAALYMTGTSTLRGPRAGSGSDVWAYLPSWIATIRPVVPPSDQVHRDVREGRRDHRVDRVRLAAAQVVGQLGGERLDPGPGPQLVRQRLADVRLVAMAERVGLARRRSSGRPARSRPRR